MALPLGNLAALRTFRVLRALKSIAVVPGKTRAYYLSQDNNILLIHSLVWSWNLKIMAHPLKIPTQKSQAYLILSEAEFCLVYPKQIPHFQHVRDFPLKNKMAAAPYY